MMMPTLLAGPWVDPATIGGLRGALHVGSGEGGDVYRVELASPGPRGPSRIALKVSRPGREDALSQEARALFLAGGAGVPSLLGLGRREGRLALALEWVEGIKLEPANLSPRERERAVGNLLSQVGGALLELHRLGFVHGDVKPDNLKWGADGRVTLLDLGLAQGVFAPLVGASPAYLDPECLQAPAVADGRQRDVFALALSAAEVLDPDLIGSTDPTRGARATLNPVFARLLQPILQQSPARRPGLAWLLGELGQEDRRATVMSRLRAAYLSVRQEEVTRAARSGRAAVVVLVGGACGEWLNQLLDIETELSKASSGAPQRVADLDDAGRARLLVLVGGPHLARITLGPCPDSELMGRLARAVERSGFGCVAPTELEGLEALTTVVPTDPVALALSLSQRPVPVGVLRAIEADGSLPVALRLSCARSLYRQGETYRALAMLSEFSEEPEAQLVRAELERRSGFVEQAELLVGELDPDRLSEAQLARADALRARIAIDRGHPAAGLVLLESSPPHPAVRETRALGLVLTGESDRARVELELGLALCAEDEQRSRLFGVLGMIEHHQGRSEQARHAFLRARDAAEAAGALVEEATYATGLAAAASDAGKWLESLEAAERAERIFEGLGREGAAARAVLGQISILSFLGQKEELRQRATRGLRLSELSGDTRCAGFIQLCLVDALGGEEAAAAARRAWDRLSGGTVADRLRAAARLLARGLPLEVDGDLLAQGLSEVEPRIDWWRERAENLLLSAGGAGSERELVLGRLVALAAEPSTPIILGRALMAGRQLALAAGKVEIARALHERAHHLARRLQADIGAELAARVAAIDWVQEALAAAGEGSAPGQLADIESLLRALSQRRGLRDLLRHALDLLLLWTGVERGLVLLSAPGGRLVVRAARNLGREDLSEEQLALSRSMASRALAEGRPVLTVDAQRDGLDLHRSAHALKLRSILCVPLSAHGQVLGVAYLDDRLRPGAFGPRELAWSQLIATVTALAVAEERDRLELRRAVGRASRAETRLAQQLVRAHGELEVTARELSHAKREVFLKGDYGDIIGRGGAMSRVLELVDRVAPAEVPVLITGESGTGKELIARAIARSSERRERPFIAENCAAVPETLLESTLFGHQRGAFTGATKDQAGLLVLADGGTLFLDEIGEMTLGMQAKLLRVLQDGEVRALGAPRSRKVDVRLLCATHRDLTQLVQEGRFREDLYYRLSVVPLALPPLRERPEDLDALVDHFVRRYDPQGRRSVSPGVRARFRTLPWPGNVRQLENEIRRMLLLGGRELSLADVSAQLRAAPETSGSQTLRDRLNDLERQLVMEALEAHRGNRTRAAEALGVSRFGLQKMMQRLSVAAP